MTTKRKKASNGKGDSKLTNLDNAKYSKVFSIIGKCISLFFLIIYIFILIFILYNIIFTIYSTITESKIKKTYDAVEGVLVRYKDCKNDEESSICNALYEYQVNGDIYTVSLDLEKETDSYPKKETVYYNPNKPNISIICSNTATSIMLIIALLYIALVMTIFLPVFFYCVFPSKINKVVSSKKISNK